MIMLMAMPIIKGVIQRCNRTQNNHTSDHPA